MTSVLAAVLAIVWVDGRNLPIEGRAYADTEHYYDRVPANVTTNVNENVRILKHDTAGMQFRFRTDSRRLRFRWTPYNKTPHMYHMPSTGHSGIDVYERGTNGTWRYRATGGIDFRRATNGVLDVSWTPGTDCLVNLPLYNGVESFELGIDEGSSVTPLAPRANGVTRPVVFYGTSITQGGCASRPGMAFVSIVGRHLDVPVVNLGFSGGGWMEMEMCDHLARIDASCYVLDCVANMGSRVDQPRTGRNVEDNYEPFVRRLRQLRPDVPIVMAQLGNVRGETATAKNRFVAELYAKLKKEGWTRLVFLPGDGMFAGDTEGTVDGGHPNDFGMMQMADAFGRAVRSALDFQLTQTGKETNK